MHSIQNNVSALVLIIRFINRSSLTSVKIWLHPKDLLTKHAGEVLCKYEAVLGEESVVAFFPLSDFTWLVSLQILRLLFLGS